MKINDQELKQIQEYHSLVSVETERLAELMLQQIVLEDMIEKSKKQFLELISKSENYNLELEKKYGKGVLDIATGEIKTS